MVSVLASIAVDHEFEPWLGQTKDYNIGIYYFSAKDATLKSRLVVSESGFCVRMEQHVYPRTVASVSYHYKNPAKRVGLVQGGHHLIEM
jgi:hypothetical protein